MVQMNDQKEWITCWQCDGHCLVGHDCGEDTCCCLEPEDNVVCDVCDVCDGKGLQMSEVKRYNREDFLGEVKPSRWESLVLKSAYDALKNERDEYKSKLDIAIKALHEARDELLVISCATRFGDRIQAANADAAKRAVDVADITLQKLRGEKC
ncbi:MAG: hypothetical protein ACXWRA_02650 [Pseudobdellovibrionaceae bacterium]